MKYKQKYLKRQKVFHLYHSFKQDHNIWKIGIVIVIIKRVLHLMVVVKIIFLKLNWENRSNSYKNKHYSINNNIKIIFNKNNKIINLINKKNIGVNIKLYKKLLINKEIIYKINSSRYYKINKKLHYLMMMNNINSIKIVKLTQSQIIIMRF